MNKDTLFKKMPEFDDGMITLKKISEKSGDDLFEIYSNDAVFTYCGILTRKNRATVIGMIPHFERDFNQQNRIKWGIYLNSINKLVGIIEVMDVNSKVDMLTIGYYLNQEYWNKGITTRSLKLILKYLFTEIEVNRVQAYIMPENVFSRRVLENNGFIKEGYIRQGQLWPGKGIVDLELYGILKKDYKIEPDRGRPAKTFGF